MASSAAPTTGAADVMTATENRAAAEHKNILLTFGASWCGNCRLVDKFLADPTIRPSSIKHSSSPTSTPANTPATPVTPTSPVARRSKTRSAAKTPAIPYIVILDPTGKLLAGSNRPANLAHPGNIGYPVAPWEIDWFLDMLKKSAPTLTPQDTATIRTGLTTHGATTNPQRSFPSPASARSIAKRKNLRQLLVFAVILSAAKDPDAAYVPISALTFLS